MHRDLVALVNELRGTTAEFRRLAASMPDERWAERPAAQRWSVAENVAHLNLTTDAYLGMIDGMIAEARRRGGDAPQHFRKDFVGWLLWKMLAPGKGGRTKTTAAFVPQAVKPRGELLDEFDGMQQALIDRIEAADGLPLHRVKIASPFSARVRYNGYACFAIISQHERRHLCQAQAAWADLSRGSRGELGRDAGPPA